MPAIPVAISASAIIAAETVIVLNARDINARSGYSKENRIYYPALIIMWCSHCRSSSMLMPCTIRH
jgi:hypothetical protein